MPMKTSRTPASAARPNVSSSIGISVSRPSIEKLFIPMKARCRYTSSASASVSRDSTRFFSSGDSGRRYLPDSIRFRSHTRCWWSEMCSISYAIVPQ